ncbi:hypothetical protein NKG05_11675 [Oerskovia sp. M15]
MVGPVRGRGRRAGRAAFGVLPAAYEAPEDDVQLERVIATLGRSDEYVAKDVQASDVVLQARSELGMLLATYQAQQAAAGKAAAGKAAPGAVDGRVPVASAASSGTVWPRPCSRAADAAGPGSP